MRTTRRGFITGAAATTALVAVNPKLALSQDANIRQMIFHAKERAEQAYFATGQSDFFYAKLDRYVSLMCDYVESHGLGVTPATIKEVRGVLGIDGHVDVNVMECSPDAFMVAMLRDTLAHKRVAIQMKHSKEWPRIYPLVGHLCLGCG